MQDNKGMLADLGESFNSRLDALGKEIHHKTNQQTNELKVHTGLQTRIITSHVTATADKQTAQHEAMVIREAQKNRTLIREAESRAEEAAMRRANKERQLREEQEELQAAQWLSAAQVQDQLQERMGAVHRLQTELDLAIKAETEACKEATAATAMKLDKLAER